MNFVQNIIWNSVEGFVEAGTRTAGGYAGDALIKAGDLIENSGRSVGNGLERRASSYAKGIAGQSYQSKPSPGKALPSTARKPALTRSNSSPASSTALAKQNPANTKAIGPTSRTPIGAKKYPGGNQVNTATKQITAGTKSVTGIGKGVTGGVVGGTQKTLTNTAFKATSTPLGAAKGAAGSATKALPRPYPNTKPNTTTYAKASSTNALPRPYNTPAFNDTGKKTAVKPGQSKPFNAQQANKVDEKKPYPGTNTLPGQGNNTPVKKYKPLPTMGGTAERGKVQHIAI
ncbi:hypothetical protein B0J11DRAFT_129502 [Dendryphion nanum]|uniref:Uncharacterized protein n=1 Tax=Dendryphion nanum TaxID=256645 RepID=A0A9P9DA09_9PLEO|nr:hypothetical protein B0J11DRAFT_129502 [Dendryphion nanum]